MSEVYGARVRPRRRWGRRFLIFLLVLLVLVAVALVVGDRYARSYAERTISDRVAEQIANQKATSEKPQVTVEGFPFLTQVAAGRYDAIHIEVPGFSGPAGNGRTISTKLLDVRATDVRAPLETIRTGTGEITAGAVTGTGLIEYAQLVELVGQQGLELSEKDGKLIGKAPVQALGQTFTVRAAAALTVKSGVVQVRFSEVQTDGLPNNSVIRGLINTYVQRLAFDLRVPPLPLKLAVEKVQPLADGLEFTAGARDVPLNSSGL
ncbi:LmeA family phospholipid-binding protein [Paractinoplanes rishiriensis]|uniref:DUF2993 domain-containing protein n=1 Tax=Paractinoplanes rishiriensis TaxID=1050105 RepID=A0A919K352_9ACTN|nr:DUF2993 domain-containing protein [Actinoplanes rishiriensis]GIE97939.1 hypothetical protein Ari01nite_54040 [Actinoplanes rishiriensis]